MGLCSSRTPRDLNASELAVSNTDSRTQRDLESNNVESLVCGYCERIDLTIPLDIRRLIVKFAAGLSFIGFGERSLRLLGDVEFYNRLICISDLTRLSGHIFVNHESIMVIDESTRKAYCFGNNANNKLGIKNRRTVNRKSAEYILYSFQPLRLNERVKLCSRGIGNEYHSFVYTESNKLYASGINKFMQFGSAYIAERTHSAKPLVPIAPFVDLRHGEEIIDIRCSTELSVFLTNHHNVYFCGRYQSLGQHYVYNRHVIFQPRLVHFHVKEIGAGNTFAVLVCENGQLEIYGFLEGSNVGTILRNMKRKKIVTKHICCGAEHVLLIDDHDDCYSFGSNNCGQCGNGKCAFDGTGISMEFLGEENVEEPHLIAFATANEHAEQLACGNAHSIALTNENRLYSFGWNGYQQCMPVAQFQFITRPFLLEKQTILPVEKDCVIKSVHCTNNGTIIGILNRDALKTQH